MNKLALSVLFMAFAASAEARPATWILTCAAAKAVVVREGAIVLDTSPTTYERFVRDPSFCPHDMRLQPTWAPTRDQPQCMIGYVCMPRIPTTPSID